MKRLLEKLTLLGLTAVAASLWLPWVPHRSAALVLTGLDLPEFARFMGEVKAGAVVVCPLALAAPILAASFAWAVAAAKSSWPWWVKAAALAGSAWLLSVPYPPLEREKELSALLLLLVLAYFVAGVWRLSVRRVYRGAFLLGLAAGVPALWQYVVLMPPLSRLYGKQVSLGAGPIVAFTGLLICLLSSALVATARVRSRANGHLADDS